MRSKGNKIDWCCPVCVSDDICKCLIFNQVSWVCNRCGGFGPWRERLKLSRRQP